MRIIILTLFIFISCKNEDVISAKKIIAKENNKINETNKEIIDTIFFDFEKNNIDFAVINLLEKTFNKDSICSVQLKLDFWNNKSKIGSETIQIEGFDENSEFFGIYLDSLNHSLKTIHIGYPACAYQQNGLLFYTDNNKVQLLYQFTEFSDSGWGSYVEFFPTNKNQVTSRRTNFSPDENDSSTEDMGIVEYSDSLTFSLKNNTWELNLITPKEKVYRREKKSFEEFHKQ